jgi:hypothetical protein
MSAESLGYRSTDAPNNHTLMKPIFTLRAALLLAPPVARSRPATMFPRHAGARAASPMASSPRYSLRSEARRPLSAWPQDEP